MSRQPFQFFASLLISAVLLSAQGPQWKVQYFYDKEKTSLTINDFAFPSAQYGIAVGYIAEGRREDPTSLVTSDGGENWRLLPLKETPISLYFLDETLGWMVTTKGIWRTTEAGRSWAKIPKAPDDILRVCFPTREHGVAVGIKKQVFETFDGGEHWKQLEVAKDQPGDAAYSIYLWAGFANPEMGLILGTNQPPRTVAPMFPDWLDPKATLRMRDVPHLTYSLATTDGGKTWRAKSGSLLGQTSRFRLLPDGRGIGLVEFSELSVIPSEVYSLDWHTGKSVDIFKDEKIGISDVWIEPDGTMSLSGIEEPGRVRDIIPGKVVVYSRNTGTWVKQPVDYRATALRTMLAIPDGQHKWVATDNGMILKFVPGNASSAK